MTVIRKIAVAALLIAVTYCPRVLKSDEAKIGDAASGARSGPASFASYERRLREIEGQLGEFKSCERNESPCGCDCSCCGPGWFATADYLNWRIERNDLGFAILDPVGNGVPAAGQPILSLDLGPDSAFRVAVGRRTANGWELGVRYTHLSANDSQLFAPGGSQVLAVLFSPATGLTNADSVNASSVFRYDVFDVEAGHWLDMNDSLSMLVLGGIRFASIDHRIRAQYDGGAFVNGSVDIPTSLDAIGGRLGCAFHWNVTQYVSLFGSGAFSVLASDLDARRQESNAGIVVIDATRPSHPIIPEVDLAMGIRASIDGWSLAAGYEWTNWFNAVSPLEFTDSFNGGTLANAQRDLGLHGLFVSASYSY